MAKLIVTLAGLAQSAALLAGAYSIINYYFIGASILQ